MHEYLAPRQQRNDPRLQPTLLRDCEGSLCEMEKDLTKNLDPTKLKLEVHLLAARAHSPAGDFVVPYL